MRRRDALVEAGRWRYRAAMADLPTPATPPAEPKKRVSFNVYQEVQSFNWGEWGDVGLVKSVLKDLEQGIFDRPSQVVDAMSRDDRWKGCQTMRGAALPSLPRQLQVGTGAGAEEMMAYVEQHFEHILPDSALASFLKWGIHLGLGLGQLEWDYRDGLLVPKASDWHPRYLQWRWGERQYFTNTQDTVMPVTPGDGQWLLFAPYGRKRAYMEGLVRSMYVPWLIRQWGWRDWARWSEVNGNPAKKALMPADAKDEEKIRFLRAVASIASETTIRMPMGASGQREWDVEILEAGGIGWEGFKNLVGDATVSIAVLILGQNLTTEIKGGSYSAAQVHASIRNDLLRSDAKSLGDFIHEQIFKPMARLNYGNENAAPTVTWKTDPPEDKKAAGEALGAFGAGIAAVVKAGVPIDVQKISEQHGYALREDADEEQRRAPVPLDKDTAPIMSKNEARRTVGLPASKDPEDDKITKPPPEPLQPPGAPELPPKQKPPQAQASRAGAAPASAIKGQMYADDLAEHGTREGGKLMALQLTRILEEIEAATSFDDVRKRITKLYAGMTDSELAELLSKSLKLSEVAGRVSVQEDL